MTTSTQPQTIQQQVLHVIQRASLTRTPGMTPREVLAAHQSSFGRRLTVDDVKTHMHALATAGSLLIFIHIQSTQMVI